MNTCAKATVSVDTVRQAINNWEETNLVQATRCKAELKRYNDDSWARWLYQEEALAAKKYWEKIGGAIHEDLSAIASVHRLPDIEIPQEYCRWVVEWQESKGDIV